MITPSSQAGGLLRSWHLVCLGLFSLLAGCDGCHNDPDSITYENLSGNPIGLLIDGADATGEFTDRTILTTAISPFVFSTDLTARSDGQEEIAAFTIGRPPFVRNPTSFQEGYDLNFIPFADEIVIDVTVWIVDVDILNTVTSRQNETIDALAFADGNWFTERLGVSIGDIHIVDMTNAPNASNNSVRDFDDTLADPQAALRNNIGFDNDRINIYLIRKVGGSRYYGIGTFPGNFIAIGMHAGSEDLPMHEIGHNMNLDHTGGADFNSKNMMDHSGSLFTQRQYLTEGQIFRAHTMPFSVINTTYNSRPGAYTVDCPHNTSSVACPPIEKRIWADGNAFPAN